MALTLLERFNFNTDFIKIGAPNQFDRFIAPTSITIHNTTKADCSVKTLMHARYLKGPKAEQIDESCTTTQSRQVHFQGFLKQTLTYKTAIHPYNFFREPMGTVIKNLAIEVSAQAKNLKTILLEGRDVTNNKVFNGTKWLVNFDEFTTQDHDLDVYILMDGDPGSTATITVTGIGLKPASTSDKKAFGPNGYTYYMKEINTDADNRSF
ncbi:hypothetical protein [Hymenobacter volaticus]|uniref:Uncharacterized protein n=1 Tax=Hymenobacter volaticus TaxID=2932254 RepID=A0ABY4GDT1_9BACT|nr:hypothetical protein [Hymenobacter volaticus]UOQ69038.1 hypothetical protein MUN86_26405 [Hymenobacter volaticus]